MLKLRIVGITIIALSIAAMAIAAGLSVLEHLSVIVQIIPFVLGVPGLYLGWVTYQRDSLESADLDKVSDDLADSVRKQWNQETQARAINDTDVLPVSWEPAPADLVVSWRQLTRIALAAPGDGGRLASWAKRVNQVSGSGHELVSVLKKVPTGRLVVLGEAGSGKTVLLIRLVLDLLTKRQPGAPVPIILPLASWNPGTQSLSQWVTSRLVLDYPSLKAPWKSSTGRCSLAEALLDRHILLILDGLDEVPKRLQGLAIARIGKFLTLGSGVVLSCRTGDYRAALESAREDGRIVKLHGATGISLCPLTSDAIKTYLLEDAAPGSPEAKRWEPVFRVLKTGNPIAETFRTPLILGLARSVYGLTRVSLLDDDRRPPEPSELCDTTRFGNRDDIESYLFSAFVRMAYEPREDSSSNRWKTEQAERWLSFLAYQLADSNIIAWWELRRVAPRWLVPATVGIICGIASGLAAGLGKHVGFGIGVGLGAGAIAALAIGVPVRTISKKKGRPSTGIAGGLLGAIVGGLLGGIAGKMGVGHAVWPFGGLAVALAIAIGAGSSTNFLGGLAGCLVGGFCSSVLEGVGRGLPAGIANGTGMGMCAALAVVYVGRKTPAYRLRWSPLGALCGLAIGTAIGLIASRAEGWHVGLIAGTLIGTLSAVPCGLFGLFQQESDKPLSISPSDALIHDYRTFWITAPAAGLAASVAGFFGGGLTSIYAIKAHPDLGSLLSNGLGIGVAAGIIIGLAFGLYHAASGFFAITRCWLALRRALPWRLMGFLADAHEHRGILRQSGTVYQFRHRELLRWLAESHEKRRIAEKQSTA